VRAEYTSADFETGWYFPETLRNDDILQSNLRPLPDMHDYLAALRRGQQAPSTFVAPPPTHWLPVSEPGE
jgi:hypothetical protein